MTTILDQIVARKKQVVAARKAIQSITELEKNPNLQRQGFSLKSTLLNPLKTGIIAEYKRKSPSKGIINKVASVESVTAAYSNFGASGLSVLTDEDYFGGSDLDLQKARVNPVPLLRKDFIVDEYQIIEAKTLGADVILLIAACLSPTEVNNFTKLAHQLGLEVLLELHAEEELSHICPEHQLIGINNRNLKDFKVDIDRSLRMAEQLPPQVVKIAESGISEVENIVRFHQHGFKGFLMGENFMKHADPGKAFEEFVAALKIKLPIHND
ncbi:indole-3-glycerol phosphate synthase TrpC [Gynurincola endophyticus]|jgi:indole-3-glycerol phosphate synthase|uniref:indole-3-glycerol phosphate synthase TrpC n=1 Tax=Gynurincola endophyticus TaxID=2479004 RepID=UPI000F8D7D8F|nr:indole-3-glycerol phosphate synthase TrpC [Gynurincola endophyticus]